MRLASIAVIVGMAVACAGAGTPGPAVSATPMPPLPGAVVVTRANDRGTVHARVGDTIQVSLGTEYEWRVDAPDGVVLAPVRSTDRIGHGTQAIWTAVSPGTSTVSATGTVICASGQACILIALLFTATVAVGP